MSVGSGKREGGEGHVCMHAHKQISYKHTCHKDGYLVVNGIRWVGGIEARSLVVVHTDIFHRAVVRSLITLYPVNICTLPITEVTGFIHV